MKILWVKSDFLHPTTRGGQIRTLEMLRCLRRRHEIHYVAFCGRNEVEGPERSSEYCATSYPVVLDVPAKTSLRFQLQLANSLFLPVPAAISRYRSREMEFLIAHLTAAEHFDCMVCDFLLPAINLPYMKDFVLFQHNVESIIWQRRAEHTENVLPRAYLQMQADRMFEYEAKICQAASGVIAVSPVDARLMHNLFGIRNVFPIPTGVNPEYFARPADHPISSDLIFLGSMDWSPNIEGVLYFCRQILPPIRQRRPATTLAIVGRFPPPEIWALANQDPGIVVTGTVPDVRPYLWGARVSIVPLRIGGGTRLKIYEAMAAEVPTVSTTVGAEGLIVKHPEHIRIGDSPAEFAGHCLALLENPGLRGPLVAAGLKLVRENHSWEHAARIFEALLPGFAALAKAGS